MPGMRCFVMLLSLNDTERFTFEMLGLVRPARFEVDEDKAMLVWAELRDTWVGDVCIAELVQLKSDG